MLRQDQGSGRRQDYEMLRQEECEILSLVSSR